ncbi:rRNA N6-adenosine-methyltransferase ZCCHC4 [Drosophila grimshawi]|uniref:rRNA N6-adenosine-methyltransferase ZCCHC4 n=1 Tax=Drosophila grimshawi TaxID=7222 RepID=UPI000C86F652|nr:rRNA N6-adenosine-methyltransferase ZCCHC4 [Drosophila grimshawi]
MEKYSQIRDKLLLQIEDDEWVHPRCPHGPTVLFYRQSQKPNDGYYACSAHRNSKLCNFHMEFNKWQRNKLQRLLENVRDYPQSTRNDDDSDPTNNMEALSQDEVHAQYFFDPSALEFLAIQCRLLGIHKVVCMGAPRLHFYLRRTTKMKSFLLDFDERFVVYLSSKEFCQYNMCNNHFFYNPEPFEQFLKCNSDERVMIVTDPPFGCRTELIANTLRSLTRLHNRINNLPATPLPIFWVYPYYMANYIVDDMPEMQICDYKLNYTNHSRYTNVGESRRCHGSPVRVFTNVPLELLQLPPGEGYKYCRKCERFTAVENVHCDRCGDCCSRNGQSYRHCQLCDLCVKPNYVHCPNCRRCCQRENHNCALYQSKQRCWICGQRGHIENNCGILKCRNRKGTQKLGCLLCGKEQHTERRCPMRSNYLKETQFMGQTTIVARKGVKQRKRKLLK